MFLQTLKLSTNPLFFSLKNIFSKVPITSDPLMALYCWTGNVCGSYWFTELRGTTAKRKYSVNINQCIENIENFYDEMAADYEEVIRKWGYNMPETIVDTLVKFAGLSKNEPFELLDLGCGPGLCGMTLKVTLRPNSTTT